MVGPRLAAHDEHFGFGHLFEGVANAFAAETGVLAAAIREVVDAERGHVVDQHPAVVELAERAQGACLLLSHDLVREV